MTVFDDPRLLDALAAAYAAAGRFEDAVATATEPAISPPPRGMKSLAQGIAERIALYQSHRPFVAAATQPTTR
jgi:hypothetical protein